MSNIIVMAFSPRNIVGCLLKKGLQRGVTGTPGPPSLRPCSTLYGLDSLQQSTCSSVVIEWCMKV